MITRHLYKPNDILVYLDPKKENSKVCRINDLTEFMEDNETKPYYEVEGLDTKSFYVTEALVYPVEQCFTCPQCGCLHPETEAWVDINTNQYVEDIDDNKHWCPDCEDHIRAVEVTEYYAEVIEKLKSNFNENNIQSNT